MRKVLLTLLLAVVCVCLAEVGYGSDIIISVSPNTLVLDGSEFHTVTVHTNLDYDSGYTVELNDIAGSTYRDSRGDLVARFRMPSDSLSAGKVTLALEIEGDGVTYTGSDTIYVVDKNSGPKPGPGK